MPTYDDALALFHDWTKSDRLRRHAYAVEAAMEGYANLFGEDVLLWRITGLLHDLDYEQHPHLKNILLWVQNCSVDSITLK